VYHSGEPGLFIAILRCWAHAATPGTILAGIDWVRNELATMMKGREATTDSERADSGHGPISVKLVLDAVAMRLLKIGEAVKSLSPELTESEPDPVEQDRRDARLSRPPLLRDQPRDRPGCHRQDLQPLFDAL
jgi:hypothetical protein